MVKYVVNTNTELNGGSVSDIANWLYANTSGKIFILNPGQGVNDPIVAFGGEDNEFFSSADKETVGTIEKTSYKEGMRTNPLTVYPSSYFMPVTPWISPTLPGPLSVISNPELLIRIIALTAVATESEKYSYHKKTLPLKITDNQEIEDMLFN